MEEGSLLVTTLGRKTKFIDPLIRTLTETRAKGLIGLYSKEPKNPVEGSILENWEMSIKKVSKEFGSNFPVRKFGVDLSCFEMTVANNLEMQQEVVLSLSREITKGMQPDISKIVFQIARGRRALSAVIFNVINFLIKFKDIDCSLRNRKYSFITNPVSLKENPNLHSTDSSIKSSISTNELGFQLIPLMELPFIDKKDVQILNRWGTYPTQKELSTALKVSQKRVSEFKKKVLNNNFINHHHSNQKLNTAGEELKRFYHLIYPH